ncbi:hypothetical protein [Vreelandella arctica]|tara:strand:+ start:686 stop:814 length:129 start_codon:yes stop_codon:yes gene_type:complete
MATPASLMTPRIGALILMDKFYAVLLIADLGLAFGDEVTLAQ